jgi:digeranylgeranylglycerophospholipid reductase
MYDAIVIGAGPAGLSFALEAGKIGLRAVVLERSPEIGYPMKTSALTWADVVRDWALPGATLCQSINAVWIKHYTSDVVFERTFARPVAYTLNYHEFLKFLARGVAASGGEIRLGERVLDGCIRADSVRVKTERSMYHGRVAVDCSGPAGVLIRRLRQRPHSAAELGLGLEWEMANVALENYRRIEFHVGRREITPVGYGWVFPVGRSSARIGVCTVMNTDEDVSGVCIERLLRRFTNRKRSPISRHIERAQPIEAHRGAYHLAPPFASYANRLLGVGDAVSHASSMLGEGIRYALVFGQFAARTVREARGRGDFSSHVLRGYAALCDEYVGEFQKVAQTLLSIETDRYWHAVVTGLRRHPRLCLPYMRTELGWRQAKLLFGSVLPDE